MAREEGHGKGFETWEARKAEYEELNLWGLDKARTRGEGSLFHPVPSVPTPLLQGIRRSRRPPNTVVSAKGVNK